MNKKIILISLFYMIVVFFMSNQYLSFETTKLNGNFFIQNYLFTVQKFMFNITVIFTFYLYIFKRPFNSSMIISRDRVKIFEYTITHGIKLGLLFTLCTFISYWGISYFRLGSIIISVDILINLMKLFFFVFTLYLIFLLSYIKTNNQILSIVLVYGFNMVTLASYYSISFAINKNFDFGINALVAIYFLISLILLKLISTNIKKKDYIND